MAVKESIRWTLEKAAMEFGLDRTTLSKRITTAGIVAGEDKKFSTAQICEAVFGDLEGEKLLKMKADRRIAEQTADLNDKMLLRKSEVYDQIDKLGIELKANIMACNISEDEKRDVLKTMQANLSKI